jgi:hypothetical protein
MRAESPPHHAVGGWNPAEWTGPLALESDERAQPWALPKAGIGWAFGPKNNPENRENVPNHFPVHQDL